MSTVEERVVGMKFNNADFAKGVQQTLTQLEQLNKALQMKGATTGLADVSAAARSVQLGHIASAVDGIADRFRAMSVVAITALATIAHKAFEVGSSVISSLTTDPINKGLQEYQTNINSIQTILSNTRWQNTGLDDVNKALDELNHYSDQTIYNFSQMARNIGTFTAAGVKLDVATGAIKGIANLAAVSGSNAEQASMAMYQLSQALATGTVKLIDWNSVVNAGMGGKVFQDALMNTARVHGVAIDQMLKDAGSFRATLEQGWLSAQILTETLSQFTGDLTREQVISMGYTEEQADAIIAMGLDAQNAATKVKTVSQLLNTLQESAGSGWAKTWQLIFGDFEEARTFFTKVNDVLGAFIQTSADARNQVLSDWKALGGRTVLIDALSQAFQTLMSFVTPIRLAFRDMFPRATGIDLYNITVAVRDFFENLRLGYDTMHNLRRTLAGVFAVFGIGYDVVVRLAGIIFRLFGLVGNGSGEFLATTASIGDFLVALREAIRTGEGFNKFFEGLEKVLTIPVNILKFLIHLFATLFKGFDPTAAANGLVKFTENLGPLGTMADFIVYAWTKMMGVGKEVANFFMPLGMKMAEIWNEVSDAVGGVNFGDMLAAINTGTLISFVVVLRNMMGRGGVAGVLNELTGVLGAMQTTLHATTLLEIALAVGVLAVSISVLSKIDSDALTKALAAISVMFVQLLAAMTVMGQIPGNSVARLYVMAAAMTVVAIAVNILAIAVKQLADLSWEELIKGLTGVGVLLAAVTASAVLLPDGAKLISTGLGIVALAFAIKILASAVQDLSGLSWEELIKGLVGVAGLLAALTLYTRFAGVNAGGVLAGAGLVLLAASIKILASAIMDISAISWENVGKGLAVLAGSLILMTDALLSIPPSAPFSAAAVAIVAASMLILAQAFQQISGISWENVGKGFVVIGGALILITAALVVLSDAAPLALTGAAAIFIVATAMVILAEAMTQLGGLSWEEIAKGLTAIGGAMLILVVGLNAMEGSLPGAFALLVASNALAVLAVVLLTLSRMSIGDIVKGLLALVGMFVVLGLAGALMGSVVPALLGLGVAILLIGAGLALAGAGIFLFAAGLTALSVAGAAGAAAVVAILSAVISLIPTLVKQLGIAILILIDVLIEGIPKIVELVINLIMQLLQGLDKILPQLAETVLKLLILIFLILENAVPQMIETGLKILIAFLEGIRDNIYRVYRIVGQIIEGFLRGIGDSLPGIIEAGVQLILSFIRGLTNAINAHSAELGAAGGDLAWAIITGMANGLWSGVSRVADAARGVAKKALDAALSFLGINSPSKEFMKVGQFSTEGMAVGMESYSHLVEKASENVAKGALSTLKDSLAGVSELLSGDIDTTPVITPVIDLSDARRNARELWTMLDTQPRMSLDSAYSSAKFTAAQVKNNQDVSRENSDMATSGDHYEYNQYNSSPKPLSSGEIYRQTKNQLSILRTRGGLPK